MTNPASPRARRSRRTRVGRIAAWFIAADRRHWVRRLRWGRIAGALTAASLAAYAGLATTAFGFVRYHRGMDTVRFADVALPWRWPHYRVARGDHHVATAQRLAAEGQARDALLFARAGVTQSPANRAGRLLLANLLGAAGRPEYARDTLVDGLRFHLKDADYLKRVLQHLLGGQDDARVIALARQHLPALRADGQAGRMLALAAATAAYFRGGYDEAEDFLRRAPRLTESRDGRFLAAKIEHDRGFRELGLLRLRQLAADFPRDEEINRELVRRLRARGLVDEARRASLALQLAAPRLAGPRIDLLHAYREAGDPARVAREAEAILRDFAGDPAALLALADWAANHGDPDLVRRVGQHAAAAGVPAEPLELLAVEAAVVARDFRGALETIRGLPASSGGADRRRHASFDSLQAIAHLGLGDPANARVFLSNFLGQAGLRADNLLAVANRLAALDGASYAWQVLVRAVEIDPRNQAALARLIELDLSLNRVDALPRHVQHYLGMRRPSPDILRVVLQRLGSDLFLFSPDAPPALAAVRQTLASSPR